jgi:hypothetical protein
VQDRVVENRLDRSGVTIDGAGDDAHGRIVAGGASIDRRV